MTLSIDPNIVATEHYPQSWQAALADVVRDPVELFQLLQLPPAILPATLKANEDFPLRVPRCFVERMGKGNINDPLLKQVLPLAQELDYQPGFCTDPLNENHHNPQPGIIHKYHGRVLLVITGACAIHCRYCFRRHFNYSDNTPSRKEWRQSLNYIAEDSSIREVILSGGDPLAANDSVLAELVERIANIPHVQRLRIHSRLPVVLPQRIDDRCLEWLTASRLKVVMVIHSNHAQELDSQVGEALNKLHQAGITLLNQTVLMAGINDQAEQLAALSEALFQHRVMPYYLHLLDRVQGAAHFEISDATACSLHEQLQKILPGYLVPKLVREIAGKPSKTLIIRASDNKVTS